METTKSRGKYWVYFFLSLIVVIIMGIYQPKYFWIVLPFNFTYFAKAMNLL